MPKQTSETPILDLIEAMTEESLNRCDLNAKELLAVRVAALAAIGARPISYLAHVGPAVETGVTLEQVQNVLVAIAPIIGTARTATAGVNIAEALGMALTVAEVEEAA